MKATCQNCGKVIYSVLPAYGCPKCGDYYLIYDMKK